MSTNRIAAFFDRPAPTKPPTPAKAPPAAKPSRPLLRHVQFLISDGKMIVEVDLILGRRRTIDAAVEVLGGEWCRIDWGPVSAAVKVFW